MALTREEEIIQSQKLASIGHVIIGTAHRLRNPYKTITGYAEWLRENISDENLRFKIDAIIEEAARADEITKELLAFARRDAINWEEIRIDALAEAVVSGQRGRLESAGITVVTEFKQIPATWGDSRSLAQALTDIISNAEEALETSGGERRLTVSTYIKATSPDTIVIEVADTGPGIPLENVSRVFDPFFTTKFDGTREGLGLSASYGVVKLHGGEIYLESRLELGTTITVELPVRSGPPPR
jgi:signal transduction histidine kinase